MSTQSTFAECQTAGLIFHALAGDTLMAVPALRAIAERFGPDMPVVCGHESQLQAILRQIGFTHLQPLEFLAGEAQPGAEYATGCGWRINIDLAANALVDNDLFINLISDGGPDLDALSQRLGVRSVGFHRSATHFVDFEAAQENGAHSVDAYFALAKVLNPNAVRQNYCRFPHGPLAAEIRATLSDELNGRDYLVIHPDTKTFKMWPIRKWSELLQALWQRKPELRVVIVGYPAIPLEHYAQDARLVDCRDIPLTAAYEVVANAHSFIGIDSCMLHAADLCRVPGVGIFVTGYLPEHFGFIHSISEALVGDSPPDNVTVDAVLSAYLRVCAVIDDTSSSPNHQ